MHGLGNTLHASYLLALDQVLPIELGLSQRSRAMTHCSHNLALQINALYDFPASRKIYSVLERHRVMLKVSCKQTLGYLALKRPVTFLANSSIMAVIAEVPSAMTPARHAAAQHGQDMCWTPSKCSARSCNHRVPLSLIFTLCPPALEAEEGSLTMAARNVEAKVIVYIDVCELQ